MLELHQQLCLVQFSMLTRLYIQYITYWKGPNHAMQILKRTGREKMPTSFNLDDELVRLRMGLFNEEIPDRFDISSAKSSFIFTTQIKLLNKLLKNLVV